MTAESKAFMALSHETTLYPVDVYRRILSGILI